MSTKKRLGDCYKVAADIMMRGSDDLMLCHGAVVGQGPIEGIHHGHAWVENAEGTIVFDYSNGKELSLPAGMYYNIGKIYDVHRYTKAEAMAHMATSGHYGPWHREPEGVQ